MIIKEIYPALFYYSRCYLNQDFELIFGDSERALLAYKKMETLDEQNSIKNEIRSLINSSFNDKELQEKILNEMDCSYYYPNEWETSRAWLMHILSILETD